MKKNSDVVKTPPYPQNNFYRNTNTLTELRRRERLLSLWGFCSFCFL